MDQCAADVSGNAAGERRWGFAWEREEPDTEKEGMGILSGVFSQCQVFEAEQPGECSAARFPQSRDAFTDTSFILRDLMYQPFVSTQAFVFFTQATLSRNFVLLADTERSQTQP